eukprot:1874619-Prymnesium_polylepis.1
MLPAARKLPGVLSSYYSRNHWFRCYGAIIRVHRQITRFATRAARRRMNGGGLSDERRVPIIVAISLDGKFCGNY